MEAQAFDYGKLEGFDGTFEAMLPGFDGIVYRQETDHTCGPASVRMTLLYYGMDVAEHAIAKHCFTTPVGSLQWGVDLAMDHYLESKNLIALYEDGERSSYGMLKTLLDEGRPVVTMFATANDFEHGANCLHYSVLIGLNEREKRATIANPFGYLQTFELGEWWERFSLARRYIPDYGKWGELLDLVEPRTAFYLAEKTPENLAVKAAKASPAHEAFKTPFLVRVGEAVEKLL